MPPILALFLTLGFIVWLFRRDFRERPNVTSALWLPLVWMFLSGSRFVSQWLELFGLSLGGVSLEEGSPLDRWIYIGLIGGALYVLRQRHVRLGEIVRENKWLAAFLLYCFLAVLWSDYPFVALKRWIKVIGHPLMVLIILTEPDAEEALARVMKRCAYLLIPTSILFIKYFPQWGRGYDQWSGMPMYSGISTNKNLLGADCLILGFFFIWHFFKTWRLPKTKTRRNELFLCVGFLWMVWWLMSAANSKTSLIALILGTFVVLFAGLKQINKRAIGVYLIAGTAAVVAAEVMFGIYETVLGILGREATLTERTSLWEYLLKADAANVNPLLGAGFESFWLGDRLRTIWAEQGWQPNQAHNGYLETYLNLGLIGVFMLIGLLIATYHKAHRELLRNFEFGRFRLGFLAAAVIYNWTEAGFKTLHLVFFAFYIIAIDYKRRTREMTRYDQPERREEPDSELVFAQAYHEDRALHPSRSTS